MTGVAVLDVLLLGVLLLQAVIGWHRGFLASILGVIGLIAGGWLALWGIPQLMAPTAAGGDAVLRSIVMLFGVLLLASIGYGVLSDVGRRVMAGRREAAIGRYDSFFGSVLSAAMAGVLISLASLALYPVAPATWRGVMDESLVVTTLSDHTPDGVVDWAAQATEELYEAGFPRVFGDPSTEPRLPAETPDSDVTSSAGVRAAADSVVKINAGLARCNAAGTGSGWVVAPERIVTNAHVVAGSDRVTIQVGGTGRRHSATVVDFDSGRDLAILAVPSLRAEPLERSDDVLSAGDSAVVAGFPRGGPYRTDPARVRGTLSATGMDIYDRRPVQREIYSIFAQVQPGNSGGPLLTPEGDVAGTVFARSAVSPDTGFVITDAESDAMLDRAAERTTAVDTGSCST